MILPDLLLEPVVRAALLEDLGRGGDATAALMRADEPLVAEFVAREAGVVAGLALAWGVGRLEAVAHDHAAHAAGSAGHAEGASDHGHAGHDHSGDGHGDAKGESGANDPGH